MRHITCQRPFDVVNYIEDILGIDLPSRIDASFDALRHLLQDLGFRLSLKKLQAPTTYLNCLGILANIGDFTVSIPPEKLQEIKKICLLWRDRSHCTKNNSNLC